MLPMNATGKNTQNPSGIIGGWPMRPMSIWGAPPISPVRNAAPNIDAAHRLINAIQMSAGREMRIAAPRLPKIMRNE